MLDSFFSWRFFKFFEFKIITNSYKLGLKIPWNWIKFDYCHDSPLTSFNFENYNQYINL